MKGSKSLVALALVLALAVSVGVAAAPKAYTIGIVVKSFSNPFWMMVKTAAENEAKRLAVKVLVVGTTGESDFNTQVAQIEDFVTRKVDLIAVAPSDPSAIVPAVEAAIDAGIPIIGFDSPIRSSRVVTYVASDNVEGGRMAGRYIAERLNYKGNVAVIRGRLGEYQETERYQGFTEVINKYSQMKIVAEGSASWETDQAAKVMEDFLIAHPEIKGVFALSDRMILGAYTSCAAANRNDIVLVGLDGIYEALSAVKQGHISADVAQRPDLMGAYVVKYAVKYLDGETIDKRIVVPMVLATPDNVDPLIANWKALGF